MSVQKGKAALFGLEGATVTYQTNITAANAIVTAVTHTDTFKEQEISNGAGGVAATVAYDRRQEATFTVVFCHCTGNISNTRTMIANAALPSMYETIHVSHNSNILDGNWTYVGGGSLQLSPDGFVQAVLPCRRYGDNIWSAAPLAAVT